MAENESVLVDRLALSFYALLVSRHCILEGCRARAILPADNPLSDFAVLGFAVPAAALMHQAFGDSGELRERADKVLAELVKEQSPSLGSSL